MSLWKWYIRTEDKSTFRSPDQPPRSQEVTPPPQETGYVWDFANNQWMIDPDLSKMAMRRIQVEFERLEKFNDLEDAEKTRIAADLMAYRRALRLFVKNFDRQAPMPQCPATLTDEAFYLL